MRLSVSYQGRGKGRRAAANPAAPVPYDLYGTDSAGRGAIPFTVGWPTEPTTTTNLTVSNNTELATALATPGARVTVAAGSYNSLTLAEDDQDWIIDNGATFAGFGGSGFARVRITGGNIVTAVDTLVHTFSDLLLRNVNIECEDALFGLATSSLFQRLALVHCTIYAERTGFYTPGEEATTSKATDIILAANYISGGMRVGASGGEPAIRVQAAERVIIVDNRARCGIDGQGIKHTYRSHYGNQEYWMRRNLTEYGDGVYWQARANNSAVPAESKMGRHWCYDHLMHSTNLSAYAFRGTGGGSIAADWLQPVVVDGNVGYTNMTDNDNWLWQGQVGDTIGTNTSSAYQAPPALGAWLAADGLPPGADH